MGSMSVSSCRCCMFVSCVHPVAVLNAAFCMICILLMLVEDARGDYMEEANSTPIPHHGMSNQEESRNQRREMRDRQRDQPTADSRVMMDRQIHQPAADTLLPRPANTNVDPVIPRSATTRNGDLYPSIKGQGYQELLPIALPSNNLPSDKYYE